MNSRSSSTSKTWKVINLICWTGFLLIIQVILPKQGFGKIYIDINAPSIQKINIAIPDFKNFSANKEHPELSAAMPKVISNDLDLSGFFTTMDKEAFLDEDGPFLTAQNIRFKNWSVIGADLLLKCGYTCIGRSVEVEMRLYDVFRGRLIIGRRVLGKIETYRSLMHRIGNEIIMALTGHQGIFLTRLAFVGTSTGNKEIYICDYDGHNVKQITSDRSIAMFPRWSPLGDKILYNSYKDGGPMLYLKEFSRGGVKRISGRKGLNIGACWASDGKKLALTLSYRGNPDIYSVDLEGKIIEQFTNHWGIDVSPSYSPDGTKIAFVSDRSGLPQIYIRDLNLKREERLTFEGKYNTSPAWSKMNRIAFSQMSGNRVDISTINPDGSNLRRLTEDQGKNEDPCWSPDGRYIVFSSNRAGGYHLYIMNANGQNQRRITFSKGEQTSPSWSSY
ncbi:MAG: Tol-Pal system beta propeller repeat protein TolB [Deltaproteobacteria bacterium]|nr:Tol-Pal system beta propeller repeat protein TolB [Deltaproteobacteria bacterium]